jgi:Protein of unknown function (DUF3305)
VTGSMPLTLTIPLGVTVARERIDNPWQDFIWRPVSVFLDAPPLTEWRLLEQRAGYDHYHAATLDLELHRKETPGYLENLAQGVPRVYVVLRPVADGSEMPMTVHLVTASPHDVEAYGHLGEEIIGHVAMPEALAELLEAFVDAHHVNDVFKKRKRRPHLDEAEHQFGQEPIHVLRERMRKARDAKSGSDA